MTVPSFTVVSLVENPDGSADVTLDCSPDFMKLMFQYGFISILEKVIKQAKGQENESL
jgi:hypothetical protein